MKRQTFAWLAEPKLTRERRLVTQTFTSWNQVTGLLRQLEGLRSAA